MKPKYIPFIFIALAVCASAAYLYLNPVTKGETEEQVLVVDEGEITIGFNFLESGITVPQAAKTEADMATYNEAKAEMSASERESFYQNITEAYNALSYGGYFDKEETEDMSDIDMLAMLVTSDLQMLAVQAAIDQSYQLPITNAEEVPEYVDATEITFPPQYLLEVFARDRLLTLLYPEYEVPSRNEYVRSGVAAGLYYQSDVEAAYALVQEYFSKAVESETFNALRGSLSQPVDDKTE